MYSVTSLDLQDVCILPKIPTLATFFIKFPSIRSNFHKNFSKKGGCVPQNFRTSYWVPSNEISWTTFFWILKWTFPENPFFGSSNENFMKNLFFDPEKKILKTFFLDPEIRNFPYNLFLDPEIRNFLKTSFGSWYENFLTDLFLDPKMKISSIFLMLDRYSLSRSYYFLKTFFGSWKQTSWKTLSGSFNQKFPHSCSRLINTHFLVVTEPAARFTLAVTSTSTSTSLTEVTLTLVLRNIDISLSHTSCTFRNSAFDVSTWIVTVPKTWRRIGKLQKII